jgi:AbiV family abortive infection protein
LKKHIISRSLDLSEIKLAAQVCFRNAEELLADAELLLWRERYARAVFFSCIGMEELGKAVLCLELHDAKYQFDTAEKVKHFWDFWYHHLSKTAHGLGYLSYNPNTLEEFAKYLLPTKYLNWADYEKQKRDFFIELANITTNIKESSLYTDIFINRQNNESGFHLPSQTFKKEHADRFVRELEDMIKKQSPRIRELGFLKLPFYPPDLEHEGY